MKLKEMWRENVKHREEGEVGEEATEYKKKQERIKRRARAKETSRQNS